VAFSPDGKCLACATGRDSPLLDVATGREVRWIPLVGNAYRVAFSPDGRRLAWACNGQTALVSDVATGQNVVKLRTSGGELWAVAFSPDGRYLASCSGYKGKGTIQLWDTAAWEARGG
jgi:WD40 repeat protein